MNTLYNIVAARDFDGDDNIDLVLVLPGVGDAWIQYMLGPVVDGSRLPDHLAAPGLLLLVGASDFDRYLHPDLPWQDPSTGIVSVTLMAEATNAKDRSIGPRAISAPTSLRLVGTGMRTPTAILTSWRRSFLLNLDGTVS